ncbi:Nicastrin [Clonorchis sinensis]|uniref:Nicastrin n=1 Tax=Clonorchis sinensis TaxID=79923 RepID=A0A419PQB8_CLOSI|nr:Nicastrin [Clonorchis sinensis]
MWNRYSLCAFFLTSCATLTCFSQPNHVMGDIYHYFSEQSTSHCSRRLNVTGQIGCSSRLQSSSGVALFVEHADEVTDFLNAENIAPTVLVMQYSLFLNSSLMNDLRSYSERVVGLVVLSQQTSENKHPAPFSESDECPNALYSHYGAERQCSVTPAWNLHGAAYSTIEWPFPVVLIQTSDISIESELFRCYKQFNANPVDDTRCLIEIRNVMSAVSSSALCIRRESLMGLPIFESPIVYCDELNGVNILLSATNTTASIRKNSPNRSVSVQERLRNSSVVVLTRLDSRSMFERSAFASQGALPGISVLVSVAAHLIRQPAFQQLQLKRDLFFAFLDNEAFDFMGSGRLAYDLRERNLAAYTGVPLGWEHIHSFIELGELGLAAKNPLPTYYTLVDENIYEQTKGATDELREQLAAANERFGQISISRAPDSVARLPLPPTASLQSLLSSAPHPLPHIILADHAGPPLWDKHFESFLDFVWPPDSDADQVLLILANTLADALHRLVVKDSLPMPASISHPTPGDLMLCFVNNVTCDLLRTFLSPGDLRFLQSLKTPIPAQSYLPLDKHELKISHIVSVLLMGLTGERTATPDCPAGAESVGPYVYLMGYYNGTEQCYRTLLDLAMRFALFRDGVPAAPAWMRSRLLPGERYVRWYRSSSLTMDTVSVSLGVLLILLTTCTALLIQKKMSIQVAQQKPTRIVEIDGLQRIDTTSVLSA